jgi:hypothetical protein
MLSVPTVITGENYFMESVAPTDSITVALAYEGECISVSLVMHS